MAGIIFNELRCLLHDQPIENNVKMSVQVNIVKMYLTMLS